MKWLVKIIWLLCFAIFVGCARKPLPDGINTVAAIRELQELATVAYTVTKVVKANDNKTWYKVGDRKILITSEAVIKAGIDLSAITEKNVTISGRSISIDLPPPKILSVNLPPENIRVAFEDVSIFRSPFTNEERDGLLAQAEAQIWNSGNETGILDQAKVNTQLFLTRFLLHTGFEEVNLHFGTPVKGGQ